MLGSTHVEGPESKRVADRFAKAFLNRLTTEMFFAVVRLKLHEIQLKPGRRSF
ncbi:hypothetical protein [Rubidibacter lacunae]|uniref:hypothetical protein n=1 Tax=Rubidibacter lacunae TaxID=582514 RepID=UPI000425CE0B|nr:hypothetical protein [Rubidibacter lacunae]